MPTIHPGSNHYHFLGSITRGKDPTLLVPSQPSHLLRISSRLCPWSFPPNSQPSRALLLPTSNQSINHSLRTIPSRRLLYTRRLDESDFEHDGRGRLASEASLGAKCHIRRPHCQKTNRSQWPHSRIMGSRLHGRISRHHVLYHAGKHEKRRATS